MNIKFLFIGWCKTDTSDKIWTAFRAGENYYAGWGARGKAINFKKYYHYNEAAKKIRSKRKLYDEVDTVQLSTVFPYFQEEVEQRLTYCVLANKVKV